MPLVMEYTKLWQQWMYMLLQQSGWTRIVRLIRDTASCFDDDAIDCDGWLLYYLQGNLSSSSLLSSTSMISFLTFFQVIAWLHLDFTLTSPWLHLLLLKLKVYHDIQVYDMVKWSIERRKRKHITHAHHHCMHPTNEWWRVVEYLSWNLESYSQ